MLHLIEAVRGGESLGFIAEVPLARHVGLVAVGLVEIGDRWGLLVEVVRITRAKDHRKGVPDRDARRISSVKTRCRSSR